jgi:hypothetical protein
MKLYVKISIIISIILTIMHYKKYTRSSEEYEIQQQELDYIDGNELYNQLNPLIITFIEEGSLKYNVEEYKLYSILSFNKKFRMYNTNNDYLSHNREILMIRTMKQQNIELINPKYAKYFKENKSSDIIFKHTKLPDNNNLKVQSVDIVLREYNILFIPRHWLFKFSDSNKSVEVYSANNIFTKLFSILH